MARPGGAAAGGPHRSLCGCQPLARIHSSDHRCGGRDRTGSAVGNLRSARADMPSSPASLPADETLRRWHARAEARISWAERTRGDWDRQLRPLIAADFETAAGHRQSRNPDALAATGRMTFGPELWRWVDPNGASDTDRAEPAPGRAVLQSILERLERM